MKFLIRILFFSFLVIISCNEKTGKVTTSNSNPRSTVAPTKITFGSCNKQYLDQAYWNNINLEDPNIFVWTGDIVYADTDNADTLKKQYDLLSKNPMYYRFKKSCDIIGIWDDHDYGMSDGDKTHPIKDEARDILFSFLDVPKDNIAYSRKGAYQSYIYGAKEKSIKIILLDARYFRDKLQKDPSKKQRYKRDPKGTLLGKKQWEWLKNELYSSTASINIIVSGIQVLSAQHKYEKWENFPNERKKLLDLIESSKAKNTYIWTGDRHIAEVSKYTSLKSGYTIHDITSSGLTHSYLEAKEENNLRISPLVTQRNYGLLEIDWAADSIKISHKIKGFYNNVHFELNQTVAY